MLIGRSSLLEQLRSRVARVGRTNFTVLIEGESGAGKEVVARAIHAASPRHRGPFVAVNCAALVESLIETELFGIEERTATGVRGRKGKFELADGGTLFLDEVGDLALTAQAKLLRVLQDPTVERVGGAQAHAFDTRIICATNRPLLDMVTTGHFRGDLYYRLSGVEISVPPLRERREDIPLLVDFFLAGQVGASPPKVAREAMRLLISYGWPGNVRQLARVLERALTLGSGARVEPEDLPDCIRFERLEPLFPGQKNRTLRAWSSMYVRDVLASCHGNKRRACDVLDITYHTLQAHLANAQVMLGEVAQPRTTRESPPGGGAELETGRLDPFGGR